MAASAGGGPCAATEAKREYIIRTRDRKERKHYTDDWAIGDEEIEGRQSFNLQEKLETERFQQCFVREMRGPEFTLALLQHQGFSMPLLFKEKTGLGLRVPSPSFSVNDVRMCVGSRRVLDVMDVNTQKNMEMSMREWQKYYENPHKDRLLNVISLEFSHTRLGNYVQAPRVVRQLDWVDRVWPRHLKESQTEGTNRLEDMMYPKVQKYCLMSVKGCYTDFHIDFGGTSVWYHILKGSKVFWLIPPTERNLQLYEQWVLSGKQGDVFFGDSVEKCGRVTLTEGNTFFIPTGWIHAVYTPRDSLVFGGNFLHSLGIEKQLKIAQVEDATHVRQKFRYPFFTEMLWYVLERYVHCLLGRSHLELPKEPQGQDTSPSVASSSPPPSAPTAAPTSAPTSAPPPVPAARPHVHLTPQELHGLKSIVTYLHALPTSRKNVPELIRDPVALVKDVRDLVAMHCHDNPERAITGLPVLRWPHETDQDFWNDNAYEPRPVQMRPSSQHPHQRKSVGRPPGSGGHHHSAGAHQTCLPNSQGGGGHQAPRRRRTRCKGCEACLRDDCGECTFCQDMVKFGGPGRMKQTCMSRQCLQPMLPVTATCSHCSLDGWGRQLVLPVQRAPRHQPSSLMECSVCYEIIHLDCASKKYSQAEGSVNEDLPNSWECPRCCQEGKNTEYKPRHFKARSKTSEPRRGSVGGGEAAEQQPHPVAGLAVAPAAVELQNEVEGGVKRKLLGGAMGVGGKRPKEEPLAVERAQQGEEESKWRPAGPPPASALPLAPPLLPKKEPDVEEDAREGAAGEEPQPREPQKVCVQEDARKSLRDAPEAAACDAARVEAACAAQQLSNCVVQVRKLEEDSGGGTKVGGAWGRAAPRTLLVSQLTSASAKALRRPSHVVRPAAQPPRAGEELALDRRVLLPVFSWLTAADLAACTRVCRAWNRACADPRLWRRVQLRGMRRVSAAQLAGVARRQPHSLALEWAPGLGQRQMAWLLARLPQTRQLSLRGCDWAAASALRSCCAPPLRSLDLSCVSGLGDAGLRALLAPPPDSRPGLVGANSRLRTLHHLRLAATDISDVALRYVTQHLRSLALLDLSCCRRITDAGVAQLCTPPAATVSQLRHLDVSGCRQLTDVCLEHLRRCSGLATLDLRHTPALSDAAVLRFAQGPAAQQWTVREDKLLLRAAPS